MTHSTVLCCSRVVLVSLNISNIALFKLAALITCVFLVLVSAFVCVRDILCCQMANLSLFLFVSLPSHQHSYTHTCREINTNMHPDKHANTPKQHRGKTVPSHKPLSVWANASLPKLDHSVFDGTRCTSIKEIEGLTASQIKALNLSICLVSAQSGAGEGSERERDYRGEILGRETDRW